MATFVLPTSTEFGAYSFQIELDGAIYELDFQFNERDGFWYVDFRDIELVDILSSIKLVNGSLLLRLVRDLRKPPGELAIIDTTGKDRDPGLTDLTGEDIALLYGDI